MPETAQLRPETLAYLRLLTTSLWSEREALRCASGKSPNPKHYFALYLKHASALRARMRRETAEQLAR